MKNSAIQIILTITLSVILYNLGRHFYKDFVDLFTPTIEGAAFSVQDISFFSRNANAISLVLAFIPVACFIIWKFTPVVSAQGRILCLVLIVACMLIGVVGRGQFLKSQVHKVVAPEGINIYLTHPIPVALELLQWEHYLLGGLLIGSVISYFAFRSRK